MALDKNKLKSVLTRMIKEEVQRELPIILQQVLGELLLEKAATINSTTPKAITPTPVAKRPTVPPEPKRYSSNPILNEVLNATTRGLPQSAMEVYTDAPLTPEPFDLNVESNTDIKPNKIQISSDVEESYEVEEPQPITESAAAYASLGIYKDYRKLLKAVDKKVSERSG